MLTRVKSEKNRKFLSFLGYFMDFWKFFRAQLAQNIGFILKTKMNDTGLNPISFSTSEDMESFKNFSLNWFSLKFGSLC